ncbi:glycosyltransferase family protein [Zhihengliuella flava]|uniref:Glycosyltransferase involved in cell wall biosynthesis n=1 Tax=Zhihengliuella flava TaxID=1285193 RepID=A0A931GKJ0_9MICC|nr:glycosyltransferase [Zhihengliuella flava]MBG6083554.1 glycosyltransferase involved in cell wall biosynthesis [Zhihengliuella flava]
MREYQRFADEPQELLAHVASTDAELQSSRREVARLNHELASVRRTLAAAVARRDRLNELYVRQAERAERFKHAHARLLKNPAVRLIHLGGKVGKVLRRLTSTTWGPRDRGVQQSSRPPRHGPAADARQVPTTAPMGGADLSALPPLGAHPAYHPVPDRVLVVRDASQSTFAQRELTDELIEETLSDTARRLDWLGADVVVHQAPALPESPALGWQVVADALGRALMTHRPATVHLAVTDPMVRVAAEVAARRFNVPAVADPAVDPAAPVVVETRRYFPQRRDRDLVRAVRAHLKLEPDDVVVLVPAPEHLASAVPLARRILASAGDAAAVKVILFCDTQPVADALMQELATAGLGEQTVALSRGGSGHSVHGTFDRLLSLADILLWDTAEADAPLDAVRVRAEAMGVLAVDSASVDELRRWVQDAPGRADAARRVRRHVVEKYSLQERADQLWARHRSLASGSTATRLPRLSDVRIGLIADEFTAAALAGEATLIPLTPENWGTVLEEEALDALIVESAWAGNGGAWTRGVGHYSDAESEPLRHLVLACRERLIPTIFWNKEDPVHTDRFIENALLFDVVATTDADCLPTYLQHIGEGVMVISAPFFAQPRLHHPVSAETHPARLDTEYDGEAAAPELVSYAGTYYGDRYPERSAELEMLLDAAGGDLAIYDRQLTVQNSPYRFPEHVASSVKAGLTYPATLEAYRAHAIHLNVNSVSTSPTMFSRRVAEIAACGTPVISGRGQAVTGLFGDLVPQPTSREEARELIDYWRDHPAERRRDGWRLARHVYRSHLASHRLVIMLRTAGVGVEGASLPAYQLELDHATEAVAQTVLAQTHRPQSVLVRAENKQAVGDFEAAKATLRSAGVGVIQEPDPELATAVFTCQEGGTDELLLAPTLAEDLARLWWIGQQLWPAAAPIAATVGPDVSPETDQTCGRPAIRAVDQKVPAFWFGEAPVPGDSAVELPRDLLRTEGAPSVSRSHGRPSLLIAGHDLKFADGLVHELEVAGWNVQRDAWGDHEEHDVEQSEHLLRQADVVWCEWALGNAAWYARHVEPHQRLIVRFHSQELFTPYLRDVDLSRVDRWIFVGGHVRDAACITYGLDRAATTVVPNAVAPALFDLPKNMEARFTLGLVGMVPSQKHLDRALDLLAILRAHDERFHLVVKGKLPEEYPWIMRQEDQRQYFERQFERCTSDPLLAGAVDFAGFGMDMTDFYGRIGVALSMSDFESFHLTLADGAASGALPMSLSWPGVEDIYPGEWVYDDVAAMAADLLSCADNPPLFTRRGAASREVARQFSRSVVMHSLMNELDPS